MVDLVVIAVPSVIGGFVIGLIISITLYCLLKKRKRSFDKPPRKPIGYKQRTWTPKPMAATELHSKGQWMEMNDENIEIQGKLNRPVLPPIGGGPLKAPPSASFVGKGQIQGQNNRRPNVPRMGSQRMKFSHIDKNCAMTDSDTSQF